MRWILETIAGLVEYVAERKGRPWAIALIVCGIGICAAFYLAVVPRDVNYPDARRAREYQQHLGYLMGALAESARDPSSDTPALTGSVVAVMDRSDFPLFSKKLRYYLHKAAANDPSSYVVVVGGMDVRDIDQPLLDASKRLRVSDKGNVEIAIVAPSTISDKTMQILEKRGFRVRLIDAP